MQFKEFAIQQGFMHRRITPLWPRANGICERFMRNLGKVLRNAKANEESVEKELVNFLRNYRATPHSSTNVSPNQLMFKTKSSTAKLPVYRSKKIDSECLAKYAQLNEKSAKQTMKQYADKKLKTAVTEYGW